MSQWWEHSPPTNMAWVWSQPGPTCGLSLLLVPSLLWGFFSRFSGFPPCTKLNISKFQFDQLHVGPTWKPAKTDVASSLNIEIYLFISFNGNINVEMFATNDFLPVFDSCQPENGYLKSFSILTLAELFSCFSTSLLIQSCSREPIILTLGLLKNNQSITSIEKVESIFLQ